MGVQRIAPAIASFVERHPAVRFEVSVPGRIVDHVARQFAAGRAGAGRH